MEDTQILQLINQTLNLLNSNHFPNLDNSTDRIFRILSVQSSIKVYLSSHDGVCLSRALVIFIMRKRWWNVLLFL